VLSANRILLGLSSENGRVWCGMLQTWEKHTDSQGQRPCGKHNCIFVRQNEQDRQLRIPERLGAFA